MFCVFSCCLFCAALALRRSLPLLSLSRFLARPCDTVCAMSHFRLDDNMPHLRPQDRAAARAVSAAQLTNAAAANAPLNTDLFVTIFVGFFFVFSLARPARSSLVRAANATGPCCNGEVEPSRSARKDDRHGGVQGTGQETLALSFSLEHRSPMEMQRPRNAVLCASQRPRQA